MWREHPLHDEASVTSPELFSHAVTGIKRVKQGTEDRALRGAKVEGEIRGGVVSHFNHLGTSCQKKSKIQ